MTQTVFEPYHLLVAVTPNFNMAATAGFLDPFRVANYLDGKTHFRCEVVASAPGPCPASNGMTLMAQPLSDCLERTPDMVVVSSSWAPEQHGGQRLRSALRGWARQGATLGGLDTGAFILADAGVLKGRRATVHYEHIDAFQETYPETEITEDLFVLDGNRVTCCGGSASTDFALTLLRGLRGDALANAAARYLLHPHLRPEGSRQTTSTVEPLGVTTPSPIRRAVTTMEQNLETPLSIPDICDGVGVSQRQLDRLFSTYVGKSPSQYYRDIRLDRARGLVTQTEMPLAEVAIASGFASQVHFSRAYRSRFGLPPRDDRIEGRVPFDFRAWPMHR